MHLSTAVLDREAAAVRSFAGARVQELSNSDLLAAHSAAAAASRAADLIQAMLAGEIDRRSRPELGASGLARKQGFSDARRLVASRNGGSLAGAHRLIEAGGALLGALPGVEGIGARVGAGGVGGSGAGAEAGGIDAGDNASGSDATAPELPPLAAALRAAELSVEAGALIRSTLESMTGDTANAEQVLVEKAKTLSLRDLRRACARVQAASDPQAWRERELRNYEARHASVVEGADGMVQLTARLDAPSAAPVVAWLDAQVRDAFQRRRDGSPGREDAEPDTRSAGQIRADALVQLARHGLSCDSPTSGVSASVILRAGLDEIEKGVGLGECDQSSVPMSAGAIRALAADAEIIPMIMGGPSEVLDLGRARRLFSRGQKLALVERDGGCAWCHAPPSYCDAHHIRWWSRDRGGTDLDNGVLLCTSCHHRLHDTGWEVVVKDGKVWFVPPSSVDPARVPRLGGRAAIEDGLEEAVPGEESADDVYADGREESTAA